METILAVNQLKKVYPGKPPFVAVKEISFSLKRGEILGLLGPNGSGKTTTIQMLLGTLAPTSGSIHFFGLDFAKYRSEVLKQVSFASTYTSLPWVLSIKENLEFFGAFYGFTRKESRERFYPLLERFGIFEKRDKKVASLSAGQVTRLMLVKAFFIDPKIVLLDEPTASLDPEIANDICAFLLEQKRKGGVSILFTSHKMEEVMQVCDRAIFLKEGNIIADDRPMNLAKSTSSHQIRLTLVEGMGKMESFLQARGANYAIENRFVTISLGEENIPAFLHDLSLAGLRYAHIKIEEPSLEDFFLQIARRKQ